MIKYIFLLIFTLPFAAQSRQTASASVRKPVLKSVVINQKYFELKSAKARPLSFQNFINKGVRAGMTAGLMDDTLLTIKVLDTLLLNEKETVLVVSAATEHEHRAWLVQYNNRQKTISYFPVFYEDFVEYFFTKTTIIRNNRISVRTNNDTDEHKSASTVHYQYRARMAPKKLKL